MVDCRVLAVFVKPLRFVCLQTPISRVESGISLFLSLKPLNVSDVLPFFIKGIFNAPLMGLVRVVETFKLINHGHRLFRLHHDDVM